MNRGRLARRLLASFVPAALWVPWGCTSPKSGDDHAPVDAGVDAAQREARGIDASDPTDALPSCQPRLSTGASVFVTDSSNTLFAFDSSGKAMGRVTVAGPTVNLAGAGITLTSADVYVTITSANTVREFDRALSPRTLLDGTFKGLSLPRGIAWDCRNEELFVTNGLNVEDDEPLGVFDSSGTLVRVDGGLPNSYGSAGIAYDSDDGTLWIANYVGTPSLTYGVAEYSVTAAAVGSFDYLKQFVSPEDHQEPYAIAVCPKAAVGGSTLVVVGFIDDGSHMGKGAVQAYSIEGAPHGPSYPFTKPYSLSCNSSGLVYVADQAGLFIIDIPRGTKVFGAFSGLTPPIYGVVAGD